MHISNPIFDYGPTGNTHYTFSFLKFTINFNERNMQLFFTILCHLSPVICKSHELYSKARSSNITGLVPSVLAR